MKDETKSIKYEKPQLIANEGAQKRILLIESGVLQWQKIQYQGTNGTSYISCNSNCLMYTKDTKESEWAIEFIIQLKLVGSDPFTNLIHLLQLQRYCIESFH